MTQFIPHTTVSGEKEIPAILLLNSLGTTMDMWKPQLPMLERYFRVIRMDTRGHGASDTPAGPYTFDDLIDDAIGTLDRHGVKTASVMGCSLGSMTALGMGLRAPERIDRIVCSAARADAPPPFVQSWDDRMAIVAEHGVEALWDGTLGNWLTPEFRDKHSNHVAALKADFLRTTPAGYMGCAEALKRLDFLNDLPNLRVPTLFLSGSEDKGAAPNVMETMAKATPNSQYQMIHDAGHIINVNAADSFLLAVVEFLGMSCE